MLEKYKENHFGLSQEIHRKNIVCAKKKMILIFYLWIFFCMECIQLILEDFRCIYVTENHYSKSDEDLSVHVLPTSPRGSGWHKECVLLEEYPRDGSPSKQCRGGQFWTPRIFWNGYPQWPFSCYAWADYFSGKLCSLDTFWCTNMKWNILWSRIINWNICKKNFLIWL